MGSNILGEHSALVFKVNGGHLFFRMLVSIYQCSRTSTLYFKVRHPHCVISFTGIYFFFKLVS
jgi:hypothetical protein